MDSGKKKSVPKKDFANLIAYERKMHPMDVMGVINSFFEKITESLERGEKVEFRGFGVFETVDRKAKTGRNPNNPTVRIPIPAKTKVRFIEGKALKAKVNPD